MTSTIKPSYEATLANPRRAFIAESVCVFWLEQAFKIGFAEGFLARLDKIEALLADVASQLTVSGEIADSEYDALMRDEMHRQLSHLNATTRKALARHLVANMRTAI